MDCITPNQRPASLRWDGLFSGVLRHHPWGTPGNCRRIRFWRALGHHRLFGRRHYRKFIGVPFGAAVPRLVEVFFPKEKLHSIRFLQSSPRRTFLFLVVFMIPGTPKDLLCYFAGLTDMKFPVFLLICSLGRLPSLVTSTIGGDALGTQSYLFAAIVFAVTLLISGAGLLCYRWICKRHNREHPPHKPQD